jgi:phosphatidate cytidylyltransferase
MKAMKRDAGVRYWGNRSSITGAVGLLDRIAVLCFAAPVFFHSVRWYFELPMRAT